MIALIVSEPGEHGFQIVAFDDAAAADAFVAAHPQVSVIRKPLLTAGGYDRRRAERADLSDEEL